MADKLSAEDIPVILDKATNLINQEIDRMTAIASLTLDDSKLLVSYCSLLSSIYKEYKSEVLNLEKDLKTRTKEDLLNIIKTDA